MLPFREIAKVCKAGEGFLNSVKSSVGIDMKLINNEQVTVYRGDQDNPILKEVVINPSKIFRHTRSSVGV